MKLVFPSSQSHAVAASLSSLKSTTCGILLAHLALLTFSSVGNAELIPLRAGPVSMVFDANNVFLRYIRVGTHEVLRGINAPVRDQNWATIAPEVSNLRVEKDENRFRVTFNVRCQQAEINFRWKGVIFGSADGVVEFHFDGEALSTFKRNRIGFCVLHGPDAAGQPWQIETVDGNVSKGHFPKYISPHQPAKNLRAVSHVVAPGIQARVGFEGDVFEMEDQRNWTDASFKTYCTPLELPYPVEVTKGTKISQKISLKLTGDLTDLPPSPVGGAVLSLASKQSKLPRLGVMVSSEFQDLTAAQLALLKALHLDHLRVDLALSKSSFVKDLRRANEQAKSLGMSLHIGLNLGASPRFEMLLKEVTRLKPPVSFWLVSGGDPTHYQAARGHFTAAANLGALGVTRITNFVDLNRDRPAAASIEAVGFAINPQIHAFDNASMMETLPIHADVVNSARQFTGDRPLVIGPMTLAPQFVDGEDPPGGPPAGPLPTYVDPRQIEPVTAAWTLGSIKYLAEAGAHSATFYETVGWNGLMDADDVGTRPAAFPSRPGELFPVYHLLKQIGEFAGGSVRQMESSDPLAAVGIALQKSGRMRVLIGNLRGQPQTISLRGLSGRSIPVRLLDGNQTEIRPELRVSLPPYGIAQIDRRAD